MIVRIDKYSIIGIAVSLILFALSIIFENNFAVSLVSLLLAATLSVSLFILRKKIIFSREEPYLRKTLKRPPKIFSNSTSYQGDTNSTTISGKEQASKPKEKARPIEVITLVVALFAMLGTVIQATAVIINWLD